MRLSNFVPIPYLDKTFQIITWDPRARTTVTADWRNNCYSRIISFDYIRYASNLRVRALH